MRKESIAVAALALSVPVALGLGRAIMGTPILKTAPDEITLSASFGEMEPNAEYRMGVGAPGKTFNDLRLTVEKDGAAITKQQTSFEQGYMSAWFDVDSVQAQGYMFVGTEAGGGDGKVTLRVQLSREEADRIGKFFIFIAKKYGPDTWYLEDGTEIDKSLW